MTEWVSTLYDQRADIIEAARDATTDPVVGPVTFDRIDYPGWQVLPTQTTQQSGQEFQTEVQLTRFFELERERMGEDPGDFYLSEMVEVSTATVRAISNVLDLGCVGFTIPSQIEDFGAEVDGRLLVAIVVTLQVRHTVDMGE